VCTAVVGVAESGRSKLAESRRSAVELSCRHASPVNHAEWDFHPRNAGTPSVLYDGTVVNPNHADKYHIACDLSSTVCDLRINRLNDTDVGDYQCYFQTDNGTLKFVYEVSIRGIAFCLSRGPAKLALDRYTCDCSLVL